MTIEKPQLVNTGSGFSVFYCNKNLYSRHSPESKAVLLADRFKWEENTLYFIVSPLLFYGVSQLIHNCPASSCLMGLETDQELMGLSLNFLSDKQKDSLPYIRTDSQTHLYQFLKKKNALHYRSCRLISLNQGYRLNQALYEKLVNFVNACLINYWNNRATEIRLGSLWIKNTIHNLGISAECFDLSCLRTEKPVYVCGAGESLETSLREISEARNKLFILSVDTALATLLTSGIKPDAVVNLESQIYNFSDFTHPEASSIPFISDISAYPPSLRLSRKNYLFITDYYPHALHRRLFDSAMISTQLPPLGSVGITALAIAERLTNKAIYFSGLDFAYIPGKTHARGTPFHHLQLNRANRLSSLYRYSASLDRPLLPQALQGQRFRRTDRILDAYAKQTQDFLQEKQNIYNRGVWGIDLKIPRGKLIFSNSRELSPSPIRHQAINKQKLSHFIRQELDYLNQVEKYWTNFTNDESFRKPLLESLEKVDYCYFAFADRDQNIKETTSFLTRAVLSARKLRQILEKI